MTAAERTGIINRTAILGIVVNVLIAGVKIAAGLLASSVAIVSEGVNNAADALTSVLTMVGTRLAGRHPDAKHPFGYGRIEYLTGLVVAVVIIVSGVQMLIESVKLIFRPEELSISYVSLAIVAVSAVVKFFLGLYTIARGRVAQSDALVGVGLECRGDSYISIITIGVAVVFLLTGVSLDAYAGVVMSAIILKAGVEVLLKIVSELIGRPGEKELATKIYQLVRATPGVVGAADMMLHNYGPNAWSGSVNVEIDHAKSVGEVYAMLHELQLGIMHEEHVTMVFGVYAVDDDHVETRQIRRTILEYVKAHEHVKSFHAVYLEPGTNRLYCDLVVDYELADWGALRADFLDYMKAKVPGRDVVLTVETEFV